MKPEVHLAIANQSVRKGLYRSDVLRGLLGRIMAGEGYEMPSQVNVVFCDDAFIAELNRSYRKKRGPTDVLSFEYEQPPGGAAQDGAVVLGDIVISLETVERRCNGVREDMRREVRLLFCHGVLHLLGWEHDSVAECRRMAGRQAEYLGVTPEDAWIFKH